MNEELTNLLEGIETANNIKKYDEVLGDLVHKAGNAIKNVFGTKAGAAQRDFDDAKQNLQTAQLNQQAAALNAQANQINGQLNQKANPQKDAQANIPSGSDVAQNIINILQKSFKKAQVTQQKATNAANKEAKNQKKENETQPTEGSDGK